MTRRFYVIATLTGALVVNGCAKDNSGNSGGGASPAPAGPPVTGLRAHSNLPFLSAKEVALRLTAAAPAVGASGASTVTPESAVQFAQSLEAAAHSPEVVSVVRNRIAGFDSAPEGQKPLLLTLGAENLSVVDTDLYVTALLKGIASQIETTRITALAVVARHPSFGARPAVASALDQLVTQSAPLSVLVRHWLATAINAQLGTPDLDREGLYAHALSDVDLEVDTLTRGVAPARIQQLFEAHKTAFTSERAALVQSLFQLSGRSS